jgi:hypothetical protein
MLKYNANLLYTKLDLWVLIQCILNNVTEYSSIYYSDLELIAFNVKIFPVSQWWTSAI